MTVKRSRCKECKFQHKRCDRITPSCSRCLNRGVKCTYSNSISVGKWANDFKDYLVLFEHKGELKDEEDARSNSKTLSHKNDVFLLNNKIPKMNTTPIFDFNNLPVGLIINSMNKLELENVNTILQYPSLTIDSQDLKRIFNFSNDVCKQIKEDCKLMQIQSSIPKRPMNLSLNNILCHALKNFFLYNNKALPLFVEKGFDFYSKPLILRLSILAAGLGWMKRDETVNYLLAYFENRLIERVEKIHQLSPTLNTIQVLLILGTGFMSPSLSCFYFSFVSYAYQLSKQLGLPFSPKKLKGAAVIERYLAYSSLNFVIMFYNLTISSYFHQPLKQENVNFRYKRLVASTVSYHQNPYLNITIILSMFQNDMANLFYETSKLKKRYLSSQRREQRQKDQMTLLLSNIQHIEDRYSKMFEKLNQNLKLEDSFKSYILFICHYTKYFIYTTNLYHSYHNIKSNHSSQDIDTKIVYKITLECQSIIRYAKVLPYHFFLPFGIQCLSECILFLVRFQKYIKTNLKPEIKGGVLLIADAKSYPVYDFLAKVHFNVFDYFIKF